jgi:ATP-dependent helicase Lhr and Lhr-like helicase
MEGAGRHPARTRPLEAFHPAVAGWFAGAFDAPTEAQTRAWPAIAAGRNVLIAAPTGSGKTFAAFLAAIDRLIREGLERGLPDATRVVYVSPLKALSNDIQTNLAAPLAGIGAALAERGLPPVEIRTMVRTGDTSQQERASMRRKAPHVVVTTPESLYVLLGSESGRRMLATTGTVIVDEIHAIAGGKRGAHLSLSLERLDSLTVEPAVRIGLSATQFPLEEVARLLVGAREHPDGTPRCTIVDAGHARRRDLALELPSSPLEAVMSGEVWSEIYDRLARLAGAHRSTLVFVNTRRMAERVARQLSERLGAEHVGAHHGSLAKASRFAAEQRLKRGELKALVATASLELGIDIGDVDLVCQLGSPRSINAFLQRAGRSGHAVGGLPKARLFALSRDELVECAALLDAARRDELDRLRIPRGALDVLSQQIAAEVAAREWSEDDLFHRMRTAHPYRHLERTEFDEVVRVLAEGFSTRRGRRGALVHRDAVRRVLKPRRGSRLTAITSGGAIPDTADYQVVLEPAGHLVGTVNEDFAVESLSGDVFQLGNTSYRIRRVERGTVRVEDAEGQPPNIPFWLGEAPGRTDELCAAVSRLRRAVEERLAVSRDAAIAWLAAAGCCEPAASQLVDYLDSARAALGCLPTHDTVVLERFFDEAGGMQLVVHAPFGSRVNRAWGLALRKRFCRQFNFELQAAATEDALILSLTTAHSFELAAVARYLRSGTVRSLLVQAVCAAPMFATRWRWVAAISLALPRFQGGRRVPPPLARMQAEDLLAAVFPDQVACAENLQGELEIPDHPLVRQTLRDCLEEAMDIERLEAVLRAIESGSIRVVARDLAEPSPLALEVLAARPYAYLDDAPLEERRTQAVMGRRWLDPQSAADIGRLDADAIERVREEAWPDAASADELHDALVWLGFLTPEEIRRGTGWPAFVETLLAEGRVGRVSGAGQPELTFAAERRALFEALVPGGALVPTEPMLPAERAWSREEALVELVRGRLEGLGPVTAVDLAVSLGAARGELEAALVALQAEGFAMRGRFTSVAAAASAADEDEWCERRLLARIHRYTVKRLRAEVSPVSARDALRFLADWQRLTPETRMQGPDAVAQALTQLEGFEAPAAAWETEILPARIAGYESAWLDEHCLAGRFAWVRLAARGPGRARRPHDELDFERGRGAQHRRGAGPVRGTPIAIVARRNLRYWAALCAAPDAALMTGHARAVRDCLDARGASFFDEIVDDTGLLPSHAQEALGELVGLGLAHADSFAGLRALLMPPQRRRRARRAPPYGMVDSGRWTLVRRVEPAQRGEAIEHFVRALLRRWGVLCPQLLAREPDWAPPWRELLMCCRRLEARGDLRGGRFIAGFSGEQFALPQAIGLLREVRRAASSGAELSLSGADPLNLLGILTPGPRLAAITANRLLLRDGSPTAALAGGEVRYLEILDARTQWEARNAVLRKGSHRRASSTLARG